MPSESPSNVRVLFQTEIVAMGGAERSLLALSHWLYTHDIDHALVTYVDHIGIAKYAAHPLTVVEIRPEMRAVKKIGGLRKYFSTHPSPSAPLLSGYQSAMHGALARMHGTHCLMHDTPDLFEDAASLSTALRVRRWISNWIVGHGLRSGGRTIVTSEYLRQQTRRLFGVDAAIARMGGLVDAGEFRPRPVDKKLRLLSVSRIESNKRIDWMLRGLASMERDTIPLSARVNWTLDVIGDGSQVEALEQLAQTLGVKERVQFRGYVSDTELQEAYANAHLFLMPAVQGYGIPAVEALARGLPVLLHRESGVSDILMDTPWATIIEGGEESMLPGLQRAVTAVIEGVQLTFALPQLPTEEQWAERVATLCGWLS